MGEPGISAGGIGGRGSWTGYVLIHSAKLGVSAISSAHFLIFGE